jgi:formylglycine-generating enzyme required for sulfatase activity
MRKVAFVFIFLWGYTALFSFTKNELSAGVPASTGALSGTRIGDPTPAVPSAKPDYSRDMALIPAGEFTMGSVEKGYANEQPRHKVFLDTYLMDRYEVSAAQYRVFAKETGRQMPRQAFPDKDNYPVVHVTWQEARDYCAHYGKSLPTEAQWEKAAGAGSEGKYCFGDDENLLGGYAWYWDNSGRKIHPAGLKKPNSHGIYDMYGNVLEWVADWYGADYYTLSPVRNPQGPAAGKLKVIKGGSAFVSADLCRSAIRMRTSPETRYSVKGFRCAVTLPEKPRP